MVGIENRITLILTLGDRGDHQFVVESIVDDLDGLTELQEHTERRQLGVETDCVEVPVFLSPESKLVEILPVECLRAGDSTLVTPSNEVTETILMGF
jgi:hypothetical protein